MCMYCGADHVSELSDKYGLPQLGDPRFKASEIVLETVDADGSLQSAYEVTHDAVFEGSVGEGDRTDWVKLELDADAPASFLFRTDDDVDQFDFSIRNQDGNLIDFEIEQTAQGGIEINFDAVEDGPVFLEVSTEANGGSYQVTAAESASLPTFSATQIAYQLTNGYWQSNGYSRHRFNTNTNGDITVDITRLNADGKNLAKAALKVWENYSGLNFKFGNLGNAADIRFDDENSGAYAGYSAYGNTTVSSYINVSKSWVSYYGTNLGGYAYQTYLHEIGHALGLGHAGNYNGSANFQQNGAGSNHYMNDSWQMSVMSYFSQSENSSVDADFAYVVSPMVADIAAIRDLYSNVGHSFKSGNTKYDLHGANSPIQEAGLIKGGAPVAYTVVDTGGKDIFDFRASGADQRIDLRSGSHSDISGRDGNLSIAIGTIIEKARGGSGDDELTGNWANNVLAGNHGDDYLRGLRGEDKLRGGLGDDVIEGGRDNDIYNGGEGADRFVFNTGDGDDHVRRYQDGLDKFDLRGTSATEFADLTITDTGLHARVSVDDITIMVKKIEASLLDASDFIFS